MNTENTIDILYLHHINILIELSKLLVVLKILKVKNRFISIELFNKKINKTLKFNYIF